MKILLVAAVVVVASAFNPGPRDQCNNDNTKGGSNLLPHEVYCQLFYNCDLEGNQVALGCPGRLLFAYGVGIATCVPTTGGYTSFSCPKWACSTQGDIGRRYPDTCCDKYWECTSINTFSEKVCQTGTRFDMNSEFCTTTASCVNNAQCIDNFGPSNNRDCRDSATSDPCKYRSQGWPFDRQCPVGTAFDTTTCSCSQFNQGCTASGISAEVLMENKKPDPSCAASGRVDFAASSLNTVTNVLSMVTFSDKLNRNIDHYFYYQGAITFQNQEVIFDNRNTIVPPYLYDYFYNDNILYAPLAITMTVKFDFTNIQINQVYSLLANQWTPDQSNTHCNPATLRFSARYLGTNLGDRRWEFSVGATGENGVDSTGTATVLGNANDYYRVVFTFGLRQGNTIGIAGGVTNRGLTGQFDNGQRVNFNTDNRSMGSALRANKCGFAIGRGLNGRIREFNVYEGCSSFNNLSG